MAKKITLTSLDPNFNRLGVLDNYKSLIWTTRYYDHGDFEIILPLDPQTLLLTNVTYYVMRDDDENVGIIEKAEAQYTETAEPVWKISGRFLTQILARRIIAEQTQLKGTLSNSINTLINNAIISPTIAARQISNFTLGSYTIATDFEAQFTGKNLYTVIHDICQQYGVGFKVTLNDNKQFVFSLYEGVDRSYNQDVNPYVVFSNAYDNILSATLDINFQNIINNVLAAGEGEGDARKTIWVAADNAPTGLGRYEFYDDARNISSNDGEITEQDYYNQLAESGRENLTVRDINFAADVNFESIVYKKDVNIGDICSIEDTRLGVAFAARIIEVIESVDASGKYTIIPTFGYKGGLE